jgi:hypothetical protein
VATKIAPLIVKFLRDAEGKTVYNDVIASKLKLTRGQVRNSVRQMIRDHPEFGVMETSPYYYVWRDGETVPTAGLAPTSGVPHIPTYEELGGEPAAGLDRIFAQDRVANPGKYPPVTEPTLAMRVHAASVGAVTGTSACEFTVVTRRGDVVILSDEYSALWAAKKL